MSIDTTKESFTPEQWNAMPPLIRERIENGQSVSAINDQRGDDNLWDFDPEEESRLADEHMGVLKIYAAAERAGVNLPES